MLISTLGKYVVSVTIVRTSRVGPAVCNTKRGEKPPLPRIWTRKLRQKSGQSEMLSFGFIPH